MNLLNEWINRKEFIYYIFVGVFATAVDWTTFTLSIKWFDLYYQVALILGLMMGGLAHYVTNKKVTFKCSSRQYGAQLSLYVLLAFFTVISSMGIMMFLINYIQINKVWARVFTTGALILPNYLFHKHITFSKKFFNNAPI
jgi:putative flippase GtrA